MSTNVNRIDRAFAALAASGKKGLLPYVTAGLPDLDTTEQILEGLATAGATAVELGFPYSDPIADGPTIQTSFTRVLERGIHVKDILAMVARFRQRCAMPLLGMLSYTIVYRRGVERFIAESAEAGLDGLIVPDLPLEEAAEISEAMSRAGLCLVMLVSPTTPPDRRRQIAELSRGFVYYMSVTGITGERDRLPPELVDNVRALRRIAGRPVVVGFGISTADHVRMVCTEADGAIIGSALVRRIMAATDAGAKAEDVVRTAVEAVCEWMTGLP